MLAIKVLMQAVVVPRAVAKQERCRLGLARLVATVQKGLVSVWKADVDGHHLVPAIGDRREGRVEGLPQFADQRRQRVGEVAILAAAETMACHDDPAPEERSVSYEAARASHCSWVSKGPITWRRPVLVKLCCDARPIERLMNRVRI